MKKCLRCKRLIRKRYISRPRLVKYLTGGNYLWCRKCIDEVKAREYLR